MYGSTALSLILTMGSVLILKYYTLHKETVLYKLCDDVALSTFLRLKRLHWSGHVASIDHFPIAIKGNGNILYSVDRAS
jgi:hypothetical protein